MKNTPNNKQRGTHPYMQDPLQPADAADAHRTKS